MTSRRTFLKTAALAAAPLILRWDLRGAPAESLKPLRIGLLADVHKDITKDADARMRVFIDTMKRTSPDCILQLGDFCQPRERNRTFLGIWNEFPGPRYHTLGNHERDHGSFWDGLMTKITGAPAPTEEEKKGFTWEQVLAFWGMKSRYYSFDHNGWHVVVLDGNEKKAVNPAKGYARYIGDEQRAWLAADLSATKSPTIVFCHQSLQCEDGVENAPEVRALIEKANADAGWTKVGACFSGHHHLDDLVAIAGVNYIQVNSMSFYEFSNPYKDPLFTTLTLDPAGTLTMEGRRTEFGTPMKSHNDSPGCTLGKELVPWISARKMKLAAKR